MKTNRITSKFVVGLMISSCITLGTIPSAFAANTSLPGQASASVGAPENLMTYAVTSSLVDLIWDRPSASAAGISYDVYQDGNLLGTALKSNYTIPGLSPNKKYDFKVVAKDAAGDVSQPVEINVTTQNVSKTLNVKDFGAVGDGKTMDTKALQKAIDSCPAQGIVFVSAGTYLTAPLFLKNNMTLYLDKGATILGSRDKADYPVIWGRWEGKEMNEYAALITGKDLKNVAVTGEGTINGNAGVLYDAKGNVIDKTNLWWTKPEKEPKGNAPARPRLVQFLSCDGVLLQGVTLKNSPAWTIHPVYSNNVTIADVSVKNPPNSQNTDGLDPDSVHNLSVINDTFDDGDDCIAIKSGKDAEGRRIGIPSSNITIRNSLMLHGHGGVSIGSEMSGGVKNVIVRDDVFDGTDTGIRAKTLRGRGGAIENMTFDNITMKNIKTAVFQFNEAYSSNGIPLPPGPVTDNTPVIKNLNFDNITVVGAKQAMFFNGLQEMPISGLTFRNISIQADSGIGGAYVQNVKMDNVTINNGKPFAGANIIQNLEYGGFLSETQSFDGKTSSVSLPSGVLSDREGSVTVSVNTSNDFKDNQGTILSGQGTSGEGLNLSFTKDNKLQFNLNGKENVQLTSDSAYNDSQWHQVTATWDIAGNVCLYVDGKLVASHKAASKPTVNGDPTSVVGLGVNAVSVSDSLYAGESVNGDNYFTGDMKGLTLYNYTLTPYQAAGFNAANFQGQGNVVSNGLEVDAAQYSDGTARFTWVPPYLAGDTFIQTAQANAGAKDQSKNGTLSFDLNQDGTVYVAYDSAATALPQWMNGFKDTGLKLKNSNGGQFEIYAKDYAAGTVSLGANDPSVDLQNMYTVFVGQGLPIPSNE